MLLVYSICHRQDCVGIEAGGEHLKECGKPFGNCYTTGTPSVETPLVPTRDNQYMRPRTINGMIHTNANVAHQIEVLEVVCQPM